ncbi:MAG TPA: DNA recombination protein RmuC [Cyanobacteria bacterium UBA9971]|nr:DNA recombination protein RmuC [Cyanobacteria bacterium UBA9971]
MEYFISFIIGLFSGILIVLLLGMKRFISLNNEIAYLKAEKQTLENSLNKETELQERFCKEFEDIAAKILKQNSCDFSKTNQEEIFNLLKPFREKLIEFETKIEQAKIEETKGMTSLETHIKLLAENNQKICQEANNLTNALKGQVKTQGNWGEFILNRLLEISGLLENHHYSLQETFKDSDNKILRPDVIIHLPENRHLIIDSKVSLLSYERFYNSEEKDQNHLKDFTNSTKEHIKNLKSKFYQEIKDINTPDFVLMFIPTEGAFNLIFQQDSEIIDFAWRNKILLVGPSTLLTTLKTIELFWKHEKQTQNVIEIAEESGKLYDKFVGLLNDLENIKTYFDKTSECFETAKRKLDGRGNLINQVEKLRVLGAKTSKTISEKYYKEDETHAELSL